MVSSILVTFLFAFQPRVGEVSQNWERFSPSQAFIQTEGFWFIPPYLDSTANLVPVQKPDGSTELLPIRRRDKPITYAVRSGDNLNRIAHQFNLQLNSLLWANNLTVKDVLSVGKELVIPPVDGVFYQVQAGDTLSRIAQQHDISLDRIVQFNQLSQNRIRAGQKIFLPDAIRLFLPPTVTPSTDPKTTPTVVADASVATLKLRRPTTGLITQGYKKGHYAIDIGNQRNTPIYAAMSGVVEASLDGWNYGYGSHIVIDHGQGVKTLYAHLNARKATVGQKVRIGEQIGLMGNSGRVFGPTGVHLHFEVRVNGRKVNPLNYLD